MIQARVITMMDSKQSLASSELCLRSHTRVGNAFDCIRFAATVPATLDQHLEDLKITWNWPAKGHEWRTFPGPAGRVKLQLHAYKTSCEEARRACFASHARLWQQAAQGGEPLLVLEDDAKWIRKLDPAELLCDERWGVLGINDPRGATRRARRYHEIVRMLPGNICEVPSVDSLEIPQGTAGASAYLIRPDMAARALAFCREWGAGPNDALLVKQLFPGLIWQSRTYFTTLQKTPSTLA